MDSWLGLAFDSSTISHILGEGFFIEVCFCFSHLPTSDVKLTFPACGIFFCGWFCCPYLTGSTRYLVQQLTAKHPEWLSFVTDLQSVSSPRPLLLSRRVNAFLSHHTLGSDDDQVELQYVWGENFENSKWFWTLLQFFFKGMSRQFAKGFQGSFFLKKILPEN